jgi:hypothetical protein
MRTPQIVLIGIVGGSLGGLGAIGAFQFFDGDDGPGDADLPANEWCIQEVWDKDLAPADFTKVDLIDDCKGALESGWNRPALLDVYEGIKADGG